MKKAIAIALELESAPLDPLSEILLDHKNRLFDFIKRRVPEKEDAEDILQDVFYLFIQTTKSVKQIEHLTSWLFRVAKNKIVDLYRKKKPEPFSNFENPMEGLPMETFAGLLKDDSTNPEIVLRKKEFWEKFDSIIESLPKSQSQVFIMNELDGLSFKEISEITGESVNTLLSRKRYAVLQLRKSLGNFKESFQKSI